MATCKTAYNGHHEGWGPVSRLREFDLTPCFEEGIVLSTLLVALLIISLFRLWGIKSEHIHTLTIRSTSVLNAKLVSPVVMPLASITGVLSDRLLCESRRIQIFLGAAFFVSLANLAYVVFGHIRVPVLQFHILEPLALLPAIFLTYTNHRRTRTSSSNLLLFWPAYIVSLLIWGRTIIAIHYHNVSGIIIPLALRSAVAVFGFFSFALELISPKFEPDLGEEIDETHVENPVLSANIFSKWSFSYMTPMLKKGAKEYITDKDLPSLLKQDQAADLSQRLTTALTKS